MDDFILERKEEEPHSDTEQGIKEEEEENTVPNFQTAGKEAGKLIGKDPVTQYSETANICKKYIVTKKFVEGIIKVGETARKKEKKEAQREIQEKQDAENKEAKEKAREEKKEAAAKEAKDKKDLVQMVLDELEETWETCEDSLFIEVMNYDPKKAQHYFTQRLMSENHFKVMSDNEDVFVYCKTGEDEGVYLEDGDKFIESQCEKRLGEKSTIITVREILCKIQRTELLKIDRESIFEMDDEIIAVTNGILNMKTKELSSFTPEKVFLSKMNAKFDPKSKCPKFHKFLDSSLPDKEEEQTIIKEFVGYTISNNTSAQKALITYGTGRTGQSTLQEIIANLIGTKNVSNLSMQDIEHDTFATSQLFGKQANMNPDIPKRGLTGSSKVKKIIRCESINVQRKSKDGFSMKPHCKLMFGCNEIPATNDLTDGFMRSWVRVVFEVQFAEDDPKRIEDLGGKISSDKGEMSGILNWLIEGYNQYATQGRFSKVFSIQEMKDFWLEHSDSVCTFYKKMLIIDAQAETLKQDVYDAYTVYCETNNKPAEDHNIFFKKLKNVCDYKEHIPSVNHTDRRRRLLGIKINATTKSTQLNNTGYTR